MSAQELIDPVTKIENLKTPDSLSADLPQPPFYKKLKYSLPIIGISVTLIGVIAWFLYLKPATDSPRDTITDLGGNIVYLEGDVQTIDDSSDSATWGLAMPLMTVTSGYRIKTGPSSKAVIALDDGSAIRLNAETEIKIESLLDEVFAITQQSGESYHRVEKSANRTYSVTSQGVKATALGTAFNVDTEEDSAVEVKVIEDNVEVEYEDTKENVEQGNKVDVSLTNDFVEVKKIDGEELSNDWISFNKSKDRETEKDLGILSDETAPTLSITSPGENLETDDSTVLVVGTVSANASLKFYRGDSWQYINFNDIGEFEHLVELDEGVNEIVFKAFSEAGVTTERALRIERHAEAEPTTTPVPPTIAPTVPPVQSFRITSITSPEPAVVKVNWDVSGYDTPLGFKVLFSPNENPTFPTREGDSSVYIENPETRNITMDHADLINGGTFNFRVCIYRGETAEAPCTVYTQNLAIDIFGITWGDVSLMLEKVVQEGRGLGFEWSVAGEGATAKGFKLVWSQASNPTYPQNAVIPTSLLNTLSGFWNKILDIFGPTDLVYAEGEEYQDWGYKYISKGNSRGAEVELGSSSYEVGVWNFRLCRYRGDSCDSYSNQVVVTLE